MKSGEQAVFGQLADHPLHLPEGALAGEGEIGHRIPRGHRGKCGHPKDDGVLRCYDRVLVASGQARVRREWLILDHCVAGVDVES
jgi:hypothetical protein